jgi:hypothetical protein
MTNAIFRIADYIHVNSVLPQTNLVNRLLEEGVFESKDIHNYIDPKTNKPYAISDWFCVNHSVGSYALHFNRPLLKNEYGRWWGRLTKDAINNDGEYIPVVYDGILQSYAVDIANAIKGKQKYFTGASGVSECISTEFLCAYKGLFHKPSIDWNVLKIKEQVS